MANYILDLDTMRCNACMRCVFICSLVNYGVIDENLSMIRIIMEGGVVIDIAVCRHCDPAPCIDVCEFDALRMEDGRVTLDQSLCTSCKACISVCPFGAIRESYGGMMIKCDLCGGDPECVKVCPTGAIRYVSAHTAGAQRMSRPLEAISEYLEKKQGRG